HVQKVIGLLAQKATGLRVQKAHGHNKDSLGKRYEKHIDGPRILNEVPWPVVKKACPTFAQWVDAFLD
ncbi:hypothetical protein QP979_06205, partial [Corynebacterium striatum]|uniref:hypothetical protein n=1 Tax=Corynebacterium striatum TaxID=43770 RepID=UPI00254AD099